MAQCRERGCAAAACYDLPRFDNLLISSRRVATWRDAMELAEPGTTYKCDDGVTISFGTEYFHLRP
jgi:hypothetical protein